MDEREPVTQEYFSKERAQTEKGGGQRERERREYTGHRLENSKGRKMQKNIAFRRCKIAVSTLVTREYKRPFSRRCARVKRLYVNSDLEMIPIY